MEQSDQQRRIKKGWMNLLVKAIKEENPLTKTLCLVNAEEGERVFDYVAGQYLTFRFDDLANKPLVRSYTMSSAPDLDAMAAVTVKEISGGLVSRYLCQQVKVGDVLRARGPIGKFCYDAKIDQPELVMIAAGSGVTPFVSIMRQETPFLNQAHHPTRMSLLVGFRSKKELILWEELCHLQKQAGNKVHTYLSKEPDISYPFYQGRIDSSALASLCEDDFTKKTYMLCGPEEMMNQMQDFLLAKGILKEQIKLESFF